TMVSALPKEPYVFLYSKKGVYSKIYKIDARKLLPYKQRLSKLTIKDGGQFKAKNEVVSVAGYVIEWFLAMDGSPKAALHSIDNNLIKLNEFTDDNSLNETELASWDWSELKKIKENTSEKDTKLILPVSMSEQAGVFYSFDFNEDQKRTVYRSNYNTGEHDVVIKSNAYKIINLIQASDNRLIGVRVLKAGMPQTMFLEMMQGQKSPIKPIQELDIVIDSSLDKNTQVVYRESHNMPGRYFVKSPTGKESYIGSVYPNLDNKLQAQLIEDEVVVEDMKIPYLLSMPTTASKPWPLIVMPHGGPIGIFDNRYFNLTTQYLVSRGYAVLRVNFRGSGGYSEELLEAGKKQFGNLILTDIHAATKAVVARADINADKVCIAGLSYGGYAAAMLAIKQPDYYRCAVSIAGVSDVNLFLNSATISEAQIRWSKEYIGDSSKEYDALLAISPINYIQDLSRPILIMHGAKDTVVDIEHAYRMKLLLDKYNKTYEWYVEPEGEHHFNKPSDAQAMFDKMLTFIDAYIN
ncbi:MAG: alpha/beta fold hydrolase, partial [Gammaproteobacteria bacterium]|nr:alpha/beta fold hydrolase [Gammaproteobacteria bacterium]